MFQFNHFNFNVFDLEKSIAFYKEALGLDVVREKAASDGSFILKYLGDGSTSFQLELTWLRDRTDHTISVMKNSIWHSQQTITMLHIKSTKIWAASHLKIRTWAFTLLRIRMDTGLKSFRNARSIHIKECVAKLSN